MSYSDTDIINQLKQDNPKILKHLFDLYYKDLMFYSIKFVVYKEIAEEIVQDIFIRIWNKRQTININKSIKSYLFTSVKNRSLNYLRSKYAKTFFVNIENVNQKPVYYTVENDMNANELKKIIHDAIHSLPAKCKIVFNLSRNAGLSTKEIADQLNISQKTVQNQIGIAMQKIKELIKDQWDNIPS